MSISKKHPKFPHSNFVDVQRFIKNGQQSESSTVVQCCENQHVVILTSIVTAVFLGFDGLYEQLTYS